MRDIFGSWDEPPDEPNDSALLEDELTYFPADAEDIDQLMYRLTGERLPAAGKRAADSWQRPRYCLGCGSRDSAAFNRAANYYICFSMSCTFHGGVGVGGDNTATRQFRPQINTAVRKVLGDERWGNWVKVLRRDIWGVASEFVLSYANGAPGDPNDAGMLPKWLTDVDGDLDQLCGRVYTALYGDLRNWATGLVARRRREAPRGQDWLEGTDEGNAEFEEGGTYIDIDAASPRIARKARPEAVSNVLDVYDEKFWPPRPRGHDHIVNGISPQPGCPYCAHVKLPPGMRLAERRPLVLYAYPDGSGQCQLCGGRTVKAAPVSYPKCYACDGSCKDHIPAARATHLPCEQTIGATEKILKKVCPEPSNVQDHSEDSWGDSGNVPLVKLK
jgi:hypothetical protein